MIDINDEHWTEWREGWLPKGLPEGTIVHFDAGASFVETSPGPVIISESQALFWYGPDGYTIGRVSVWDDEASPRYRIRRYRFKLEAPTSQERIKEDA